LQWLPLPPVPDPVQLAKHAAPLHSKPVPQFARAAPPHVPAALQDVKVEVADGSLASEQVVSQVEEQHFPRHLLLKHTPSLPQFVPFELLQVSAASHTCPAPLQLGPGLPAPTSEQDAPPAAQTWHVPQPAAQQIFVVQLALEHSQWLLLHSLAALHALPSGCLAMQVLSVAAS